jgi:hypothetical protein
MSLIKTIGELSDYANSVGGLLRLKRREEKWVHVDEWIALNHQVKELEESTRKLEAELENAKKAVEWHEKREWTLGQLTGDLEEKIAVALKILDDFWIDYLKGSYDEVKLVERLRLVLTTKETEK